MMSLGLILKIRCMLSANQERVSCIVNCINCRVAIRWDSTGYLFVSGLDGC